MADIFTSKDAVGLLRGKKILFLGDSNMRATYKDLLKLMNSNQMMDMAELRKRGEPSFEGDKRFAFSGLIKGRQYVEGRRFHSKNFNIRAEYHFITRCFNTEIEKIFNEIKDNPADAPNVIIMNSCLWDITRWGPTGADVYRTNMMKLMKHVQQCIPEKTMFIWMTTFPVATKIRGGLLFKQIDFMQSLLQHEIMEANLLCSDIVSMHGYNILDTHFHLRMHIHRRLNDGIHYGIQPVRFITNLVLTHIAASWHVKLPGNFEGVSINRIKALTDERFKTEIKLPKVPSCLKQSSDIVSPVKSRKKRLVGEHKRPTNNYNSGHNKIQPWQSALCKNADILQMATKAAWNILNPSLEPFWKDAHYANFTSSMGNVRDDNARSAAAMEQKERYDRMIDDQRYRLADNDGNWDREKQWYGRYDRYDYNNDKRYAAPDDRYKMGAGRYPPPDMNRLENCATNSYYNEYDHYHNNDRNRYNNDNSNRPAGGPMRRYNRYGSYRSGPY